MKKQFILVVLLLLVSLVTILRYFYGTGTTEQVLASAGENKVELKKTLNHYPDSLSLKQDAATFLINNLGLHYTIKESWYLPNGERKEIDPRKFKRKKNVEAFVNDKRLVRKRDSLLYHPRVLQSDFLIKNVDLAFESWNNAGWKDSLLYNDFREYVLPYCVENEMPEDFRTFFHEKYPHIKDSLKKYNDPVQAARYIKRHFSIWHWYRDKSYVLSNNQSISELFKYESTDCTNYAILLTMAFRSYGIAASMNHVPYWGNTNLGHCISAVLGNNGKWVNMDHSLFAYRRRPGKVFRSTYSKQEWTLAAKVASTVELPPLLRNSRYRDVTAEFGPVANISLAVDTLWSEQQYVFASVYNMGHWHAIHWSKLNEKNYCFTDMVKKVVYLPSYYRDSYYEQAGYPLYVDDNDSIIVLKPNYKKQLQIEFTARTVGSNLRKRVKEGDKIYLYVWDKGWKYMEQNKITDSKIIFKKLPESGLFKLEGLEASNQARPFTYTDRIYWW
ncbi:hypothetical protein EMN47_14015 [Prolixibacteraceae bacterium JC049]|nr:hypothetical protein [Prolixibacteraceae bacterium JC049]